MYSSIEEIVAEVERLYKSYQFLIDYKIEDRTRSIIKFKIQFSPEIFIQCYVNVRKPKLNYALILNDIRLYGKDFLNERWHRHPFDSPEFHDSSYEGQQEVTLESFFLEVTQFLKESNLI
jgi:hypothetical protein